jgi:hypothetical protein
MKEVNSKLWKSRSDRKKEVKTDKARQIFGPWLWKMQQYEMQLYKMQLYEMLLYKMQLYEMQPYKMQLYEMQLNKMQLYEIQLYEMKHKYPTSPIKRRVMVWWLKHNH